MTEITIKNLQKKVRPNQNKIKKLIRKVLKEEKADNIKQVNICLTDDSLMKKFNLKYKKEDNSTDVLSFEVIDRNKIKNVCADIVISTQTACKNAKRFKTTPQYEIRLYCIHGLLHLLGYNDNNKQNAAQMRERELLYANT